MLIPYKDKQQERLRDYGNNSYLHTQVGVMPCAALHSLCAVVAQRDLRYIQSLAPHRNYRNVGNTADSNGHIPCRGGDCEVH